MNRWVSYPIMWWFCFFFFGWMYASYELFVVLAVTVLAACTLGSIRLFKSIWLMSLWLILIRMIAKVWIAWIESLEINDSTPKYRVTHRYAWQEQNFTSIVSSSFLHNYTHCHYVWIKRGEQSRVFEGDWTFF